VRDGAAVACSTQGRHEDPLRLRRAPNLWVRKLTHGADAGGKALVVFRLRGRADAGHRAETTLVSTGSPDNVVVIRQGSQTEVQSGILRDQAALIETAPEVARGPDGRALVSKECGAELAAQDRPADQAQQTSSVRGLPEMGVALRPQARIVRGGCSAGSSGDRRRRFGGARVRRVSNSGTAVVRRAGLDGRRRVRCRKSGFDSEIWGDGRPDDAGVPAWGYSSVIARLATPDSFEADEGPAGTDPRLKVSIKRETKFYEDQSPACRRSSRCSAWRCRVIFCSAR